MPLQIHYSLYIWPHLASHRQSQLGSLLVRNLTAIVRLDNAKKINISKSLFPPPRENHFVRKFMVILFIDCLNLGYGQCSLFLPRLLFITWDCWKEDRRQHEKRDALLFIRPSQVLCCICLQQKFVKFLLQPWRYRCVTETWLPWAAAIWSSNGANDVCSSFNFASASLWDK